MEGISSGVTLPGDDDDNWVAGQRLMEARLRSLLVGRFELRTHMDTKDMQAFSLIISGTSARRNSSTKDDGYSAGRGALRCTSTSMADLEGILSSVLGKPLFDRTGLSGSYQFILRWAGDDLSLIHI